MKGAYGSKVDVPKKIIVLQEAQKKYGGRLSLAGYTFNNPLKLIRFQKFP